MLDEIPKQRNSHSAVYLDNCLIIVGGVGKSDEPVSMREIWMYNLYTEKWRKLVLSAQSCAPEPCQGAAAVAIDRTLYIFGGITSHCCKRKHSNELWTLSKSTGGCFTWRFIETQCKEESPSPRAFHTGWAYAGKLWTFGGIGLSSKGYLNDHGHCVGNAECTVNNQLLCYDPNSQTWTNPQCFGDVPSPRTHHACASMKKKVWLFGGSCHNLNDLGDMFELTMHSLTWTQIQTGHPRPQARSFSALTAQTDDQLVLHGGSTAEGSLSDTWILDLTSHSWRTYTWPSRTDNAQACHTGSLDISNNVIILGGYQFNENTHKTYEFIFHVMLEPKRLQQLAVQTVYKHQKELPLKYLPTRLISLFGFSEEDQTCVASTSEANDIFMNAYPNFQFSQVPINCTSTLQ